LRKKKGRLKSGREGERGHDGGRNEEANINVFCHLQQVYAISGLPFRKT
jgi:hypothetical protein